MKTEYILCAAIWYKDIVDLMPRYAIYKPYLPVNCDKGVVMTGHRHGQCMYAMIGFTGKRSVTPEIGEYVQGFLTSKNRFVDRKEAVIIAIREGQLKDGMVSCETLYSEDLY